MNVGTECKAEFQFNSFRSEDFSEFSYENLIGYYNFLRLIPVQYYLMSGSNADEFKSCIREMLLRKIDVLSIQTKMPSSRAADESEKATQVFLNEFFSEEYATEYNKLQESLRSSSAKNSKNELSEVVDSILESWKEQKKAITKLLTKSKNNTSAVKKYVKSLKDFAQNDTDAPLNE